MSVLATAGAQLVKMSGAGGSSVLSAIKKADQASAAKAATQRSSITHVDSEPVAHIRPAATYEPRHILHPAPPNETFPPPQHHSPVDGPPASLGAFPTNHAARPTPIFYSIPQGPSDGPTPLAPAHHLTYADEPHVGATLDLFM